MPFRKLSDDLKRPKSGNPLFRRMELEAQASMQPSGDVAGLLTDLRGRTQEAVGPIEIVGRPVSKSETEIHVATEYGLVAVQIDDIKDTTQKTPNTVSFVVSRASGIRLLTRVFLKSDAVPPWPSPIGGAPSPAPIPTPPFPYPGGAVVPPIPRPTPPPGPSPTGHFAETDQTMCLIEVTSWSNGEEDDCTGRMASDDFSYPLRR